VADERPVLVSACLLGIPCRWHGRKLYKSTYIRRFERDHPAVELVPVCPEELGGLPTPRPPVKRIRGRVFETCPEKKRRREVTGKEVTAAFEAGARATLAIALERGCQKAILCQWSPSCDQNGITGRLLAAHGLRIINTL
jgi:uncharacterized protein YbbK (DUF523 family)